MKEAFSIAVLLLSTASVTQSVNVCNVNCDGRDPALATPHEPATVELFSRKIILHISETDDMAFGSIDNGDPGDEVWLDRTFDGGLTWEKKLGKTKIPAGSRGWRTMMFNIDSKSVMGKVRACGKAGNRPDIACTRWAIKA